MLVLLGVILSMFGAATALAAEAYARAAPACHCPHDDADRAACPCCNTESSKGGCLPVSGSGCSSAPALAPAMADPLLVPVPPLSGIVATLEIARLHGLESALRLERPPRA